MRGVNKAIIIGNLGSDPEVRQFGNGGSVTTISVATSDQWTDKQTGEKKESTEWHRIVLFNRLGEIAAQYLRKGSAVYIEGKLQTRKWQDQNGQDKYTTEIRADQLQMLGEGGGSGQNNNHSQNNNYNQNQNNGYNQNQNNSYNQGYGNNQSQANYPRGNGQSPQPQFNHSPNNPAMNGGGTPDDDIPFAPYFDGVAY